MPWLGAAGTARLAAHCAGGCLARRRADLDTAMSRKCALHLSFDYLLRGYQRRATSP
jgi:hypothetical protein